MVYINNYHFTHSIEVSLDNTECADFEMQPYSHMGIKYLDINT